MPSNAEFWVRDYLNTKPSFHLAHATKLSTAPVGYRMPNEFPTLSWPEAIWPLSQRRYPSLAAS